VSARPDPFILELSDALVNAIRGGCDGDVGSAPAEDAGGSEADSARTAGSGDERNPAGKQGGVVGRHRLIVTH
jgi:hypothetical protein